MPAPRTRGDRFAAPAAPPNDVYTGLLLISLLALLFGCVLLFLDYRQYEGKPPAPPTPSAARTSPPAEPPPAPEQQPPAGNPTPPAPGEPASAPAPQGGQ